MTFSQLKADVYRRCGFSSSPATDVATRIGAFINEVQQDILSEPGMEFLLNDTITLTSVANQQTYGLPIEVAKIKAIRDTTNLVQLAPMSLGDYRQTYPNPAAVTGTPRRWVDLGFDAVDIEPSDASTLFVVSSSASDIGTARIEGFRSGGIPFTDSVVMTGATAVAFTYNDVISVTKFFISATAVGTVTLREDSGTGTTLATIPIGQSSGRYRRLALAPTPAAVLTYTIDCERYVTDMVQDTDEPVIPPQFHRLLAVGARAKEYEKQNQIQRWQVARGEFAEELKKLKFWIYSQSVGVPNLRGTGYVRSTLGDGSQVAATGGSSSTPLAATAGGTGFGSYAVGDLLYADTATSFAKLSDVAVGKVLKSGGVGVAPAYGQIVNADVSATAAIAYSKLNLAGSVNLASDVTGDLPFANLAQGSALSVLGVTGNATADVASIAAASDAQVLRRSGTSVAFGAVDLSSANAITGDLPVANLSNGTTTKLSSTTTSNQNNWAPGLDGNTVIFWSGAGDITITGFAGGVNGQIIVFKNTGTNVATFSHNSGSSSAGNKLFNYATSAGTPVAANGYIAYQYDGTQWQIIGHEQGAWVTPSFSAGNYTSSGTWTVASGDVTTQQYRLSGRSLTISFYVDTTTVSGTPTSLVIGNGAWGGFTCAKQVLFMALGNNAGGGNETCFILFTASSTSFGVFQVDGGTWSNATDTTKVFGQVTIEVT